MKWIKVVNEECDFYFARLDDDGKVRLTGNADNPELIAWIEAGNEVEDGTL